MGTHHSAGGKKPLLFSLTASSWAKRGAKSEIAHFGREQRDRQSCWSRRTQTATQLAILAAAAGQRMKLLCTAHIALSFSQIWAETGESTED